MKTNFSQWVIRYREVLFPFYNQFKCLFPEGEEPTFNQFLVHCFRNTKQTYDPVKKMLKAPIYY